MQVNPEHLEDQAAVPDSLVTTWDLGFYIVLCVLATFDRQELLSQVMLGNTNVRLLLESETECREVLTAFHMADYSACLKQLQGLQNRLRLDPFLSDHVLGLYRELRSRTICQVGRYDSNSSPPTPTWAPVVWPGVISGAG